MEPIGGYLGLEQSPLRRWHGDAIALDLGRHVLEVVLLARGYRKLLAPRYTCDVLAPAIRRAKVELTLYDLDGQLDPVLPEGHAAPGEALLYTNYFGLKQATVERLAATVPNLILDYAQDFYGKLPVGVDGFVTCRKFIGGLGRRLPVLRGGPGHALCPGRCHRALGLPAEGGCTGPGGGLPGLSAS